MYLDSMPGWFFIFLIIDFVLVVIMLVKWFKTVSNVEYHLKDTHALLALQMLDMDKLEQAKKMAETDKKEAKMMYLDAFSTCRRKMRLFGNDRFNKALEQTIKKITDEEMKGL